MMINPGDPILYTAQTMLRKWPCSMPSRI